MNAIEIARESLARECDRMGAPFTAKLHREGRYDEQGLTPAVLRGVELALELRARDEQADIATAVEFGYRACERGDNLQKALIDAQAAQS